MQHIPRSALSPPACLLSSNAPNHSQLLLHFKYMSHLWTNCSASAHHVNLTIVLIQRFWQNEKSMVCTLSSLSLYHSTSLFLTLHDSLVCFSMQRYNPTAFTPAVAISKALTPFSPTLACLTALFQWIDSTRMALIVHMGLVSLWFIMELKELNILHIIHMEKSR